EDGCPGGAGTRGRGQRHAQRAGRLRPVLLSRGGVMVRTLPLLAAGAALALCGLVHGLWADRWGTSEALTRATDRLGRVPAEVGDWVGEDEDISRRELALSGATSCLVRRYTRRGSGETLTVILLCGKAGPVSVHTPD